MTKTILIVDDIPANLRLLGQYLKPCPYKKLFAQSGDSALKIAESVVPSLIFLDVMMPGLDGLAVCRHLKANPRTQAIPIILMIALTDLRARLEDSKLGAIDYLTKPLEEKELLVKIRIYLDEA